MKTIPLTQGQVALVDDADYEALIQFKWFAVKEKGGRIYYAARNKRLPNGRRQMVQMHRDILGVTDPKEKVDHENSCGTDNRRRNIRVTTNALNIANSRKRRGCTSNFKGVYLDVKAKANPWRAAVGGKTRVNLGSFSTELQAARAYNRAAKQSFGKFARLNQI